MLSSINGLMFDYKGRELLRMPTWPPLTSPWSSCHFNCLLCWPTCLSNQQAANLLHLSIPVLAVSVIAPVSPRLSRWKHSERPWTLPWHTPFSVPLPIPAGSICAFSQTPLSFPLHSHCFYHIQVLIISHLSLFNEPLISLLTSSLPCP